MTLSTSAALLPPTAFFGCRQAWSLTYDALTDDTMTPAHLVVV